MPELPFQARSAVEAFASMIGLEARPARDGSVSFLFRQLGTLSVTPTSDSDRILMSFDWMPSRTSADLQWRLFARAGADPTTGEAIHTGMAPDGSFICALSVEAGRLDLPSFDERLRTLISMREDIDR